MGEVLVTIIINNKCSSSQIHIKTNLEAVAVSISICSIYSPPRSKIVEKYLHEIVNQLRTPFLLLGDLNGHNFIWGSDDVNDKGRIIEKFINKNSLCLYNKKTSTYLHVLTLLWIYPSARLRMYTMTFVVTTTFRYFLLTSRQS